MVKLSQEEKTLLKKSVDLAISTLSQAISKVPNEEERIQGRNIIKKYLMLSDKVEALETEKEDGKG